MICELESRDVHDRVTRGVTHLSDYLGSDAWLGRIDVETLDVGSQLACVVCHVTGHSYAVGVQLLGGPSMHEPFEMLEWADYHGFAIRGATRTSPAYGQLTSAWVERVTLLRAQSLAATRDGQVA